MASLLDTAALDDPTVWECDEDPFFDPDYAWLDEADEFGYAVV